MFSRKHCQDRNLPALGIVAGLLTALCVLPAFAGGPRMVDGAGNPLTWDTGSTITFHVESGDLGKLTNAQALTLFQESYAVWADVEIGLITFQTDTLMLNFDIHGDEMPPPNPGFWPDYWRNNGDGLSPVIFDDDGKIIDGLFGTGARFDVLGVSGLDTRLGTCVGGVSNGESCTTNPECQDGTCVVNSFLTEASIVINGLFYDNAGMPDSPDDLPSDEALKAVMVHEIGHFLNLDHTLLNREPATDSNPGNDIYVPTMYPILLLDEEAQLDLHADDKVAFLNLYKSTVPTTGIHGIVSDALGPFQGAEVVVRKDADPWMTAYSTVSGGHYFPCSAGTACDTCTDGACNEFPDERGAWSIDYIDTGDYTVCVNPLDTRFALGNSNFIGPLVTPPVLPGPAECYNAPGMGQGAEGDTAADDPDFVTSHTAGLLGPFDVELNAMPTVDPHESNDTLGEATLLNMVGGKNTVEGILVPGELDIFKTSMTTGQIVRIDLDSAELSDPVTFDPVICLFDPTGVLVATSDDTHDPDSMVLSLDPALEAIVPFDGDGRIAVTSWPDLDCDGTDGETGDAYWLRIGVDTDTDGDGAVDRMDICILDPNDDEDGDGLCGNVDPCPTMIDPPEPHDDGDFDGIYDVCDNCPGDENPDQADVDGNGVGDACEGCPVLGTDPDADFVCDPIDNCPEVPNVSQLDFDGDTIGDACDDDDDNDGLPDTVETDTGTFIDESDTGSDPLNPDTDGDGIPDGLEVFQGTGVLDPASNNRGVPFGPQDVIDGTRLGPTAVHVADLDRDGTPDVIVASQVDNTVSWHTFDGTSWTSATISSAVPAAASVFAADIDDDGDVDVLSAAAASGASKIVFHENNGAKVPGWSDVVITTSLNGAVSVTAADIDGDGDLDAVSASELDATVAWYENPPGNTLPWTQHVVTSTADGVRSVAAADIDGDGDVDIVSAATDDATVALHENQGGGVFGTTYTIDSGATQVVSVFAADMDGDGDLDVAAAIPGLGAVRWYENGAGWSVHAVATPALPTSVVVDDIDRDGDADVLSVSGTADAVVWSENTDGLGNTWVDHTVTQVASLVRAAAAGDVDSDGDPDFVSVSAGDNKIAWYENRTIHRNATFPLVSVVSPAADLPPIVVTADVDGDGAEDLVSIRAGDGEIVWYPNINAAGAFGPPAMINTTATGAVDLEVADVDGDGDTDVLAALGSQNTWAWYENLGAGNFGTVSGNAQIIGTVASATRAIRVADIDRDGDLDVIGAGTSGTRWFANDGVDQNAWAVQTVTIADTDSIAASDMDGDGDADIVVASGIVQSIVWHENVAGSFATSFQVRASLVPESLHRLATADLDGDGDLDVVAMACDADEIVWLENKNGNGQVWTTSVVSSTVDCPVSVAARDLDLDGDIDLAVASSEDDTISTFENETGGGVFGPREVVTSTADAASSVAVSDLDGDGDPDLALSSTLNEMIAWYANRGGQYRLETTDLAPSSLHDSETATLMQVKLTHNGRSGDAGAHFTTWVLELESPPGTVMSGAAANAVLDMLTIYLDDGDGVLEPLEDTVVETFEDLSPAPLTLRMPDPVDGFATVDAAAEKTFFLTVTPTFDATSRGLGPLSLTHRLDFGGPGSVVTDVGAGVTLEGEYAPEVAAIVTGDTDAPQVVAIFPEDGALDVALASDVIFMMNEPLDPATVGVEAVSLSTAGFKIGGSVRVSPDGYAVTFDPAEKLLLNADYTLTVNALLRDRSGNAAAPFTSSFDTIGNPDSGTVQAAEIGVTSPGATIEGQQAEDHSGSAVAALDDVNLDGTADLLIGAPNADVTTGDSVQDHGKATLVFGGVHLQETVGVPLSIDFKNGEATSRLGAAVGRAGDLDGDDEPDFVISAPHASPNGAKSGAVYVVFGNDQFDEMAPTTLDLNDLPACGASHCGVIFQGEASQDRAGTSVSFAGDVNGDGEDDLLIGAPGASPGGVDSAGKVYLVFGPLANGVIQLADVGTTVPGLVFHGEAENDEAGTSVSLWIGGIVGVEDDLMIGAPGADTPDLTGGSIGTAGHVYTIIGGAGLLAAATASGVVELSDVGDTIPGVVFLGTSVGGEIGRTMTGAVDVDGDGVADVIFGGLGEAWAIPGDIPKVGAGSSRAGGGGPSAVATLVRVGEPFASTQFEAIRFTPEIPADMNELAVGAAGDTNNDGIDDLLIGEALADPAAGTSAGKAFLVFGGPTVEGDELMLADVGATLPGLVVEGDVGLDELGFAVGGGFDLNADGIDDAVIGARFADPDAGRTNAGETYILSPVSPDEVVLLTLKQVAAVTELEWSIPPRAMSYNVYVGDLTTSLAAGSVKTSDMMQLTCGFAPVLGIGELPSTTDGGAVPPGEVTFYLVTANNLFGESGFGDVAAVDQVNDAQCP